MCIPDAPSKVTGAATRDSVPVTSGGKKKHLFVYKRSRTKGKNRPDKVGDGVTRYFDKNAVSGALYF